MKKMYMKDLNKRLELRLSSDDLELASRIAERKPGWTIQDAIRYAICVAAMDLDVFDAFSSENGNASISKKTEVYDPKTGETQFYDADGVLCEPEYYLCDADCNTCPISNRCSYRYGGEKK